MSSDTSSSSAEEQQDTQPHLMQRIPSKQRPEFENNPFWIIFVDLKPWGFLGTLAPVGFFVCGLLTLDLVVWVVCFRARRQTSWPPGEAVKVSDLFGSHLNLTFMRFKSFVLISIKPSLVVFRRLRNNFCIAVVELNSATFLDEQMSTATLTEPRVREHTPFRRRPRCRHLGNSREIHHGPPALQCIRLNQGEGTKETANDFGMDLVRGLSHNCECGGPFKAHGPQSEAKQKMDAVSKTHDEPVNMLPTDWTNLTVQFEVKNGNDISDEQIPAQSNFGSSDAQLADAMLKAKIFTYVVSLAKEQKEANAKRQPVRQLGLCLDSTLAIQTKRRCQFDAQRQRGALC